MRYGFDKSGGFAVVDDEKRVSAYAYPSSVHAKAAKRNPEAVASEMLADLWVGCPDNIREAHYDNVCKHLA